MRPTGPVYLNGVPLDRTLFEAVALDKVGVETLPNGKIAADAEQTNGAHVYAVGDVLDGRPELAPVASLLRAGPAPP